MTLNENSPWMTLFACLLAVLFTIVGGVVALVHTESLSFEDYLDDTGKAALAVAALGVGRSLKKGLARGAGADITGSWLERAPVSTIAVGAMVLIAGVTGGVLTIADPDLLEFDAYLDQMTTFAFAVGIQGAGRAVRKGIEVRGTAQKAAVPGAGIPTDTAASPAAATGIESHPDYASAIGGAAAPDNIPEPDDLGFIDPIDVASLDEDLGASEEPVDVISTGDTGYDDLSAEDLDESGLPTDEEEDADPPPDDLLDFEISDTHELERADVVSEPSAVMPSQEDSRR